ncbi:MAG: hypothetical protein A3F41_05625 [Coxiella sp. RIFCSPHIGHO2_12_FULL_44_14]|nr:MAG: hypothetical protein A3F41_05625 [Coxiella sp. RIFCSPHIGHO2_12_FULL_44_14]
MQIILIAAMTRNRIIGRNNQLPWHLPADLRHFKVVTGTMPVLMGRKTHESIGKALPGRRNVVVSSQVSLKYDGCEVTSSIGEALALLKDEAKIFVIGGHSLYEALMPMASRMELTYVHAEVEGDVYFPRWREKEWRLVARESFQADERNICAYEFVTLDRV